MAESGPLFRAYQGYNQGFGQGAVTSGGDPFPSSFRLMAEPISCSPLTQGILQYGHLHHEPQGGFLASAGYVGL